MGEVLYREATAEDAEELVEFYNRVGGETTYLSFEKDEYPMDAEELRVSITETAKSPNNVMLAAVAEGRIVGVGTISSSWKIKARHEGELGIVVDMAHQAQGLGSEIIRRLLEWARGNHITTRVMLDTRCDNEVAVKLYEKFGFEIEGRLKNSTLLDGTYYDLYVMGMML